MEFGASRREPKEKKCKKRRGKKRRKRAQLEHTN
jgi:hypothetical protein